jgi:hypothetical protein
MAIIVVFGLRTYLKYINKRLDQQEDVIGYAINDKALEHGAALEKKIVEEAIWQSRGFRYLY